MDVIPTNRFALPWSHCNCTITFSLPGRSSPTLFVFLRAGWKKRHLRFHLNDTLISNPNPLVDLQYTANRWPHLAAMLFRHNVSDYIYHGAITAYKYSMMGWLGGFTLVGDYRDVAPPRQFLNPYANNKWRDRWRQSQWRKQWKVFFRALLEGGSPVPRNLIRLAVKWVPLESIELLLQQTAAKDDILHLLCNAISHNTADVVEVLLNKFLTQTPCISAPLMETLICRACASKQNDPKILDLILNHPSSQIIKTNSTNPILIAARRGNTNTMEKLLKRGFQMDVNKCLYECLLQTAKPKQHRRRWPSTHLDTLKMILTYGKEDGEVKVIRRAFEMAMEKEDHDLIDFFMK